MARDLAARGAVSTSPAPTTPNARSSPPSWDADGHAIYEADSTESSGAKLTAHAIDVMLLAALARPADSPALLRAIRAGQHPRIHPATPVVTIGAADELSALRAYEAGSDHHLADETGYVLLRAVLASVARRALQDITSRHITVGDLHIDTAARAVDLNGTPVRLSRREFDVLVTIAADPAKVFSKTELARTIWGTTHLSGRSVESHVTRLRRRLGDAGATDLLRTRWGQGLGAARHRDTAPEGGVNGALPATCRASVLRGCAQTRSKPCASTVGIARKNAPI